jgi:hypothetical protein
LKRGIQEFFDKMLLEKLKVPASLPMFGTSDNASNMVKAFDQSTVDMYGCNI